MKKPNITGAEYNWEWEMSRADKRPDGDGSKHNWDIVISGDDIYATGIATVWQINQQDDLETIANAQAISAVPEMIDALLEARELALLDLSDRETEYANHKLKIIEKALIKAGVEL